MLTDELFDDIIDRAGIDLSRVDDPQRIWDLAEDMYFESALSFVDGQVALSEEEERRLVRCVVEELVTKLYKLYHERSDSRE
ncbi:MAG: hypothetical protein NTY19_09145 [Planctomycetota bacterium]|nr:hypothetical protein [Planctomycetota bacterium]